MRMSKITQNPFEKLWFSDVLDKFQEKKFNINYTLNTFEASDKFYETHRFVVQLAPNKIDVTIPLEKDYEYNVTLCERDIKSIIDAMKWDLKYGIIYLLNVIVLILILLEQLEEAPAILVLTLLLVA